MTFDELKMKALSLPILPGVYIMRDNDNEVIYVGKAKKLKNRVGQYFQDTASHTPKTKVLVSKISSFDVIVAASEFEALVLECSLIKQYQPRYNILLKDDKGFPYLRVDMKQAYPRITLVNRIADDGASYYGPYGSRGITQNVLQTIQKALKLPTCSRRFPQDIGKGRVCLNYHMGLCLGWCQKENGQSEFYRTMEQTRQLLSGNYKMVAAEIRTQMLQAAESLNFELAARLRDQLNAIEALGNKQLVTAGSAADTDVIGFAQTPLKACFAVLHYRGGDLLDKEYSLISAQEDSSAAVSALIKQYYLSRAAAPKVILLPFDIEDRATFEELLQREFSKKVQLKVPQRGENVQLVELACRNALEEVQRVTSREEKLSGTLMSLSKMLGAEKLSRIESYDISNISGTDIVGSMVVFQDGKPKKSAYKRFKINGLSFQDDYESMRQVLMRRFTRFVNQDAGFEEMPDLVLIDGGVNHAKVAQDVLSSLKISTNIYGMVKDGKHRTRALVNASGQAVGIDAQQAVFSFVGNIQEQTHNFAISYHRKLRSSRLKRSKLDNIFGIGTARKELLLKTFKSVSAIEKAELRDLERILPKNAARSVYDYFRTNQ